MQESRHFGLVGGLGVGATVLYYQAIAAACAKRQIVPRLTMAHAHAPTALAHVEADRIDALATYLGGFVRELAAAGAGFFAIPAITPHICRAQLQRQVAIPMVDILAATAQRLAQRQLSRVALFGTRFTIDSAMFGALGALMSCVRGMTRSTPFIAFTWNWRLRDARQPTTKISCAISRAASSDVRASKPSFWPARISTLSLMKPMPAFPRSTVRPRISRRSWRRWQGRSKAAGSRRSPAPSRRQGRAYAWRAGRGGNDCGSESPDASMTDA